MKHRKNILRIDLEGPLPCLLIRSTHAPAVPELLLGVRVDFLRSRSARFHAGVIALVADWHARHGSTAACHVGREYADEIALLATAPILDGQNPIAAPYRAILGMWAEYDDERGIRTESYCSYAFHVEDKRVPNDSVSPEFQALLLHLLKGSGEASARNLRLRLDLESCGLTSGDIEIRGWLNLLAQLKAKPKATSPGVAAVTSDPETGLIGVYEGLSLDTTGSDHVQRFRVEFTPIDDETRVSVLTDSFAYGGKVHTHDTVFYVVLEGVRHPERLTFVLERPLSNDRTALRGVFCAINPMRRPVAGKILLRRSEGVVEPARLPLDACDPHTAAFLRGASGGILVV